MKKIFLLATVALFVTSASFADDKKKSKAKGKTCSSKDKECKEKSKEKAKTAKI